MALAAVGLVLLYGSSLYIQPEEVTVDELRPSWIGKKVKIDGNVTESRMINDTLIMTVRDDTGSLKVAQFRAEESLRPGEAVEVSGTVKMYQGRMEVVADDVSRLTPQQE